MRDSDRGGGRLGGSRGERLGREVREGDEGGRWGREVREGG